MSSKPWPPFIVALPEASNCLTSNLFPQTAGAAAGTYRPFTPSHRGSLLSLFL